MSVASRSHAPAPYAKIGRFARPRAAEWKRMARAASTSRIVARRREVARPAAGRRRASIERTTRETSIAIDLVVDGSGSYQISTGVPFLDHMLELFTKHGIFDLTVKASGDLEVDQHHTVEDVGLTLGQAFRDALGGKEGIRRFGQATVPLDEALVSVVVDLSGRPFLVYELEPGQERVGNFDTGLVHDFLLALVNELKMNLHVDCIRGRNPHHMIEATFKALARAMDQATSLEPRVAGVLSTKGML
jgi:imidazoleglycerol-phosphate dehydratase